MANNPIVLALRFLLELFALFSLAYWGWTQHVGLIRIIWTIGLPSVAAVAWGTLRVPGHPGAAPVPVPGIVRLLLEAAIFGGAIWALYAAGRENWALIYGIIVLVHYLLSYDYVVELLRA